MDNPAPNRMSYVVVIKWEKSKAYFTVMSWTTEKDVRMFILSKLQVKAVLIVELYVKLEKIQAEKPTPLHVDVEKMAA